MDYREIWHDLDIIVQKIEAKNNWKNLPSTRNKGEMGQLSAIDAAGGLDSNGLEMSVVSRGNVPLPPP